MGSELGTRRAVEQGCRAGLWTRAAEQDGEGHMQVQACAKQGSEELWSRGVEQDARSRAVEEVGVWDLSLEFEFAI